MKVVHLKAAKAAREHKRYSNAVLEAYDRIERNVKRVKAEEASEVRRKARKSF
jgi:hypothetical protein